MYISARDFFKDPRGYHVHTLLTLDPCHEDFVYLVRVTYLGRCAHDVNGTCLGFVEALLLMFINQTFEQ